MQREGDRKILGSGLRLGGLGDSLRKLGTLDWVLYRMAAAVLPVIVSVTLSTERGDQSKEKVAIGKKKKKKKNSHNFQPREGL